MTPPYLQSTWESIEKKVRVAELVACCNYFSKKKKKTFINDFLLKQLEGAPLFYVYWRNLISLVIEGGNTESCE